MGATETENIAGWVDCGADHWSKEGVGYVMPPSYVGGQTYEAHTWDLPARRRRFYWLVDAKFWLDKQAAAAARKAARKLAEGAL